MTDLYGADGPAEDPEDEAPRDVDLPMTNGVNAGAAPSTPEEAEVSVPEEAAPSSPQGAEASVPAAAAEDAAAPPAGEPLAQPAEEPAPEPVAEPVVEAAPQDAAEEAAASAEAQQQVSQESLFAADAPPVVVEHDEGVTSFGGVAPPEEIAAITAELAAEADAGAETAEAGEEPAAAAPTDGTAAARETTEGDEEAAIVAATGAPEGASDDADAVEALLDAETQAGVFEMPRDRTMSVPFFVYLGVWFVFAVTMVVLLQGAAVAKALDSASSYPIFVFVGLTLTALGPLLAVFLWVLKRSRSSAEERTGLFATAILRGALATFGGVVMWWIALVVLNYMKTGRLL